MAALTADRNSPAKFIQRKVRLKMAAVKIFAGGMVCRNASGFAVAAADTATFKTVVGRAAETVDNVGGAAGDKEIEVEAGVFRMNGSGLTQANEGDALTVVDDNTVGLAAATTNDIPAGTLDEFDGTSDGCWVRMGM